jgi:hypothetical protein
LGVALTVIEFKTVGDAADAAAFNSVTASEDRFNAIIKSLYGILSVPYWDPKFEISVFKYWFAPLTGFDISVP